MSVGGVLSVYVYSACEREGGPSPEEQCERTCSCLAERLTDTSSITVDLETCTGKCRAAYEDDSDCGNAVDEIVECADELGCQVDTIEDGEKCYHEWEQVGTECDMEGWWEDAGA